MSQVTAGDLKRTYSDKADEELLVLHARGTLTELAYETIEAELTKRGVPVPPRPQTAEAFPKRMTREERIAGLKVLVLVGLSLQ